MSIETMQTAEYKSQEPRVKRMQIANIALLKKWVMVYNNPSVMDN